MDQLTNIGKLAFVIAIVSLLSVLTIFLSTSINDVGAQEQSTYTKTDTVGVMPKMNATANALCENGDGLTTGGYTIGFPQEQPGSNLVEQDVILYSNHPQVINEGRSILEGWQAGLINNSNQTITITAHALCIDFTL